MELAGASLQILKFMFYSGAGILNAFGIRTVGVLFSNGLVFKWLTKWVHFAQFSNDPNHKKTKLLM